MDFLNIQDESEIGFRNIADKLFNEYAVSTHDSIFRLGEIEFYWNSKSHIDNTVYKRNHVEPKSGEWFFHYSGVDIALKNDNGFGGILIRRIRKINSIDIFNGPQVCAMKLFSGTNAFSDTIQTKIIPYKFSNLEIKHSIRIGLGKNAFENEAYKLKYRFYI